MYSRLSNIISAGEYHVILANRSRFDMSISGSKDWGIADELAPMNWHQQYTKRASQLRHTNITVFHLTGN